MDAVTRKFVTERANNCCEYCHFEQASATWIRFHIEHVRARQHGGDDALDNLCLSCPSCNQNKGPNQSGYDPETGGLTRLFNPRLDSWESHFRTDDGVIYGLSPVDRATVSLLQMNRDRSLRLRQLREDESAEGAN